MNDVALAVVNALKMPETIGQTYELGGPHVYSLLECYELMHNVVQRPPKLAYVNKNTLLKIGKSDSECKHSIFPTGHTSILMRF